MKGNVMKRFVTGVVFIACVFALAGCGTMKGFGEDMQTGGKNIQQAAD